MSADTKVHRGHIDLSEKPKQPKKNANIAAMNSRASGYDASKRRKALRNRIAITLHTSSAVAVQEVMAQLISFARRERWRDRRVARPEFPEKRCRVCPLIRGHGR
jgi:hypothetical protein